MSLNHTASICHYCLGEVKWSGIEVNWHCESCCLKCSEITPSIDKQDLVANEVKEDNAMGTSRLLANVKQTSVANMNMVRKVGSKRRRRRLILEDEDVDEDVVPREAGLNVDENKNPEVETDRNYQNLVNLEPDVDYANGVKKLDMRGCTFPESSSRDVNNDLGQSLGLEGNVCENISCNPTLDEASNYMEGWPLFEPVWSGSFCIRGYRYGEMRAHLSNTACEKVFLVARSMPTRLSIHVHQRSDVWPKSFQKSPPHGGHIALYFFPNSNSGKDEHSFEMLLDDLITSDLALKVCFDDSELLVFPSLQLPEPYHRFHQRYYIWGVFKNKSSDGLPHIDGSLRKGRASLHSSDHLPGRIIDSVDSLPSIISSPSLCSPTPDDIQPHGMVDSVKIKLRSGSKDSVMCKMVLPHACLSHPQQLEPSHCEIKKLQRDEVTENVLLPLDMKTCNSVLKRSGLCQQDCNSSFEFPVFSNAEDGVPIVGNRQPELGEVQDDTSNCLNLFPLAGEDLAVMVRMGDNSGISLELGLSRMTAKRGGSYKNTKPLEPGRSLLC
ncbi:uncharacterized protein LOC116245921 isoform X2 [Nymphaea colorata]|uniref:uncharacterized protein LOC116245921 isoform X2 n=1 Tax=Nymphaea colorata TaxID=210225 RepID=UPI00214F5701|nr:uncharacterized protein LOC116245921 isoform X2 [Nymphaea colorata]XP_049933430.1 uncharacterized protein LOC116245921 isoform X2 [Nymphaea colorata]